MDRGGVEWHALDARDACARLRGDDTAGLTPPEAARRLADHGPNALPARPGRGSGLLLLDQFRGPLPALLAVAAAVMALLGEAVDAIAVAAILAVNGLLGWHQERRAADALGALRRLAAPTARVLRGGATAVIAAADLVPGDLVILEPGDRVPADLRLLRTERLSTVEAALTGESAAVPKRSAPPEAPDRPLAERRTMAWSGTSVATGTAAGVVVATGPRTEFGRIAALVRDTVPPETPLQRRMRDLGRMLAGAAVALIAVLFLAGILRGRPAGEMFLAAVSLAVAAVPEGLPAVVTVAMALGVTAMARRRALVRRLPAVETLGCASVIASDKTGTLTVGEMTLRALATADGITAFTGEGYAPEGSARRDGAAVDLVAGDAAREAVETAALGSTARVVRAVDGAWAVAGDPTEGALIVAAGKAGVDAAATEASCPLLFAVPFDAAARRMAMVRRRGTGERVHVKGAPEVVLPRCVAVLGAAGETPLDDAGRARLAAANASLAAAGLRVLALARRDLPPDAARTDAAREEASGEELLFLGLAGLHDPPRPGAREAVAACADAGIRVLMVTGDQPATALAVARDLGIAGPADGALTGADLDAMDDGELRARLDGAPVFARVSPAHKLRVVRAWMARGEVVAVTGDGVNDAPALRGADIGVAMGRSGTDVAKDAAALVLTDDDFSTLVAAVHEGRRVYENIRKTVLYLLGGNLAEILVMAMAILTGLPLPLLPAQILWVNLVTDGIPALALAADPADPDLLRRPPRRRSAGLADGEFVLTALAAAVLVAAVTLTAFLVALQRGADAAEARTLAFTTLVAAEVLKAFALRSRERLLWELGALSNGTLAGMVALTLAIQVALPLWPAAASMLGLTALAPADLVLPLALGVVPVSVLESAKILRRLLRGNPPGAACVRSRG